MRSLLVYDIESSGLRPLDQVLSFAAIRTDMDLREIERISIEVDWRRDMIPSAEAYLVHQIGISGRDAISEADAITKIHKILNQPNTLSGGYNTLGFDDEFLRFSFYRCLLPPYTHQYQNGCGRFDVLPLVVFYYLYANDIMTWPLIDAKPSFKLEALNAENKWVDGRSHEAMTDVEVTLALMRILNSRKDIWTYLMGFYDKHEDQKRTYQLLKDDQNLGIMVSLRWGYERLYQVPVMFLGPHDVYKNQVVLLRLDMPLKDISESDMMQYVVRKKFGEPGFVLPYRSPYKDKLSEPVQSILSENLEYLKAHLSKIKLYCCAQVYDSVEGVDIDVNLYQKGFLTAQESEWSQVFHDVLEKSLDSCPTSDLKEQALRYLWRFYPEKLMDDYGDMAEQSIAKYITTSMDYRNRPGLRIEEALSQIEKAKKTTSDPILLSGLDEIKQHIVKVSNILETMN